MRTALIFALAAAFSAHAAIAQQAPFDMQSGVPAPRAAAPSGTVLPFETGVAKPRGSTPGPAEAPRSGSPAFDPMPQGAQTPLLSTADPAPTPAASSNSATPPGSASASAVAPPPGPSRFILPVEKLRLEGELDARSWSVFLTQEEALADTTLSIGYTNAIMVMPEASRLRASINNEVVYDAPIASPGGTEVVRVAIRKKLLRAGQNRIKFEVVQRHRTDCTVNATYELWTQIESAVTGLSFANASPDRFRSLDDLPAVGSDVTGATTLWVVPAGPAGAPFADRMLRVVQAIAIRGRYQHLVVRIGRPEGPPTAGSLAVVIGTASELRAVLDTPSQEIAARAFAGFVSDRRLGPATLVLSGSGAAELDSAVEMLVSPTLRSAGAPPTEVDTSSWHSPDAPLVSGARSIRLSNLDIGTQEFSGRRFTASTAVALPGDFYAEAYGEAVLYLDAAYSPFVKPGSHFNVYVNGRIASTLALNGARGGIFQRFPLKLPLRNFRPGVNEIVIEAVLLTDSDARCVPGGTVPGPNRFVLFDTSELSFNTFGRVGRYPDLAAFSASAFPYQLTSEPVAVVLGRHDASHYAAAATLFAKLAHSAGRPIRVETGVTAQSVGDQEAIFIGTANQLTPGLLSVVGLADTVGANWANAAEAPTVTPSDAQPYDAVIQRFRDRQLPTGPNPDEMPAAGTEEIRDRWRKSLGNNALRREVTSFEDWLRRTFSISFSSFSFFSPAVQPFEPVPQTSVIIAQGSEPQGAKPWTVLVGRREDVLEAGVARLTDRRFWRSMSGQLTAFQLQTLRLDSRAPAQASFIPTQSLSFLNTRQIVANWFSANMIFYAAMLLAFCALLGIATSAMLKGLGRR